VILLPILVLVVPGQAHELAIIYALLAIFIVFKHRENIDRIRKGTESKFSFRAKGSESDRAIGTDPAKTDKLEAVVEKSDGSA
jgi:hypothetical protein